MPALQIDIRDNVSAALARIKEGLAPPNVNPTIGTAVKKLFQEHFVDLPQNKAGFPTTNFWAGAARSTTWQLVADGVVIRVDQEGVRYQWLGGDIEPSKTYLTIPATDAAYGHRAREFDLQFAIVPDPESGFLRPALVARRSVASLIQAGHGKHVKHTGDVLGQVVFYWLVRHAHKEPNPNVLPSEAEITQTAVDAVNLKIAALWRQEGRQ